LKIAILGTRGIPANYGGFETFAEECAAGLSARGHDITVYCRSHYVPRSLKTHRGVRLVVLPTLRWKYTDTVIHTLLSVIHAATRHYDLVLLCNAANAVFAIVPRLFGTPVILNVDGIERTRKKWGAPGRWYYRCSEFLATRFPNVIVSDARVIQRYYEERYGTPSVFIPYGAALDRPDTGDTLERVEVRNDGYFLYVSRLEPENNAHLVIQAYARVKTDKPLLIVGDAPYARDYIRLLHATRDPRVRFTGAIYGTGYRELQAHAFCYVHATEVGGTHPALIEAMGQGNIIVANGTPENEEVLAGTGLLYLKNDPEDLARRLQEVEDRPQAFAAMRSAARERARSCYSWTAVVADYERLCRNLLSKGS